MESAFYEYFLPPQKYRWSAFNLETQNIFSHRKEYEYGYYPLCWAIQLGPPRSNQKFFQIKKADRDEEKAKQARMQLYWRQFRDPDFDPNQYHVHHSVPLFLGGEDNLRTNAIILPKGIHLKGHQVLRTQPQMQFPPRPLRPLPADLYQHPIGTKYVLVDFKDKADEICYGHSIV